MDKDKINRKKVRGMQHNVLRKVVIAGGIIAVIIAVVVVASPAFSSFKSQLDQQADNTKLVMHIHPHIKVIIDGKPAIVPANIGIDPSLWQDHSLDSYGMKMPNMPSMSGMAPTHTHDTTGTIHVESTVKRDYTLGEFLDVWGIGFSAYKVVASIDGNPVSDYRNHVLKDGEQIELDITTKPS